MAVRNTITLFLWGGMLMSCLMSNLACNTLKAKDFPEPAIDVKARATTAKQTVVLAGGCFWCTEAVFEQLKGVKEVTSGYAGGAPETANYEDVSSGVTEHAEAIQITYDPSKITYGQILKVFFSVAHDPTQLNRQGPDYGRQYRSAIFYAGREQKRVAEAYIAQLEKAAVFPDPIVTEVVPLQKFYAAEEYHQDFVRHNPDEPYVTVNAIPKVEKVRKQFRGQVKQRQRAASKPKEESVAAF